MAATTKQKQHTDPMQPKDVPYVLAIDRASFRPCWDEDTLMDLMRNDKHVYGAVVRIDGAVRGFVVYKLFERHVELLRLAVDPAWRKRGYGRLLLGRVALKLSVIGHVEIQCTLNERNLGGQLFLRSCGMEYQETKSELFGEDDGYVFALYCRSPANVE